MMGPGLKTTVKIVKDPNNRQHRLNQELAAAGAKTPEISGQQHAEQYGARQAEAAAQAALAQSGQTPNPPQDAIVTKPLATNSEHATVTHQNVQPPAPAAFQQPKGCRVTIHTPVVQEEIAPGVRVHRTAAFGVQPEEEPASEPASEPPQLEAKTPRGRRKASTKKKVARKKAARKKVARKKAPRKS